MKPSDLNLNEFKQGNAKLLTVITPNMNTFEVILLNRFNASFNPLSKPVKLGSLTITINMPTYLMSNL